MSLFAALTGLFRVPQPALAEGATPSVAQAVTVATPVDGRALAPPTDEAEAAVDNEPSDREKAVMLHLSNVSHACNHFQNQMLAMLYPFIMADLGMSYADLGVLSAIRSMVTSLAQGAYGFLTPFVSRTKILGFGNFGIAIGTLLSGAAVSFPMLVVARSVGSLGSSAQHPVGYSILSSYFPKKRAQVIAMNTSASNVGTLIATPLATVMLLVMGWRHIFFIVAFVSVIMGAVYLIFRDYGSVNRGGSGKGRLKQGLSSYKRVLKNRNMLLMALVFMVGAAGAENGVNATYFAPHLANDFGYSVFLIGVMMTAINVGQIGGPIVLGWLSDRMSRVGVLQASLALSAVGTLWVAFLGPGEMVLFVSLLIYSAFTSSRGPLTQTIIGDLAGDEDRDAAFSLYFLLGFLAQPFWLLVTGFLMDTQGFSIAVSRLAGSYLVGMLLLFLVKDVVLNRPNKTMTA
jgi:predicted MFS family arabinose efflux permease